MEEQVQTVQLLAEPSDEEIESSPVVPSAMSHSRRAHLRQQVLIATGLVLSVGLLAGGLCAVRATTAARVREVVSSLEIKSKEDKQDTQDTQENLNSTWFKNARPGEPWPSLYCWSHMEEIGNEKGLLVSQLNAKFGIFACNDFAVISRSWNPIYLGPHPWNRSKVVRTWPNPLPPDVKGNPAAGDATASYKNARTFLIAWKSLIKSGLMWRHDWIVKCDPDAVFYPARLREKVKPRTLPPHGPGPFYYYNCWLGGGKIYGALEVYSLLAMQEMGKRGYECEDLPMDKWGEDLYMEQCMIHLNGAKNGLRDYTLVGDQRCTAAACTDSGRAAFHPMPDLGSYWACAKENER